MMPGLTGVELAIRMKAACPDCRVILISGQAATLDILGAAREEGHQFEVHNKPVSPLRLLELVNHSLEPSA